MKPHLHCAEQQVSPSNLTKYCACHAERLTYWVLITYETSFTMRGATGVTIQPHQILRLSRKKTHILSPHHIWNVIYSARSNRPSRPTSPNTAPATQNDHPTSGRNLRKTGETSFPMRGRSENDPTMIRPWNRQSATRLATEVTFRAQHEHFLLQNTTFRAQSYIQTSTKYCTCHEKWHLTFTKYCACHEKWHHGSSSSHIKPHLQCAEQQVSPSNLTKYCTCHAKRLTFWVLITYETSFPMREATGVTIQPHQILRLPRKMTLQDLKKISKNRWNVISNAGTIRAWSENDPRMIRPWKRKPQPASPPRLLFELTTSIFYWKIQRFAPNLTFKPSPNTAPATKSDTWTSPSTAPATKSDTWTSPNTAPATKSDTWTSPNTAPDTKNDSYAWSSLHMKPHFQCAKQQVSLSNLTKYCACHEKWHCKI